MEEWKDIKGYEGLYMISSLGRVKSLQPRGGNRNGTTRKGKEHILTPYISKHKGRKYELSIDDIKRDINNEMINKEIANKYKCSYGIISTRKHQIKKGLI